MFLQQQHLLHTLPSLQHTSCIIDCSRCSNSHLIKFDLQSSLHRPQSVIKLPHLPFIASFLRANQTSAVYNMADGSHYLKINDNFCCKFNLSIRSKSYNGLQLTTDTTNSKVTIHHDSFYSTSSGSAYHTRQYQDPIDNNLYSVDHYLASNLTWEEVRRITSRFTGEVIAYCDSNTGIQVCNLSEFNVSLVSREEYLAYTLGPRHISAAALVILSFLYIVIFLTGVLGNLCTCVVITRNRCLHTATNYYLFSLAISDVLTLLLGEYPFVVCNV